jgi:hypothetical protein
VKLLRWAFLAVPLAGLAELGAHFYFAKRPPSFDDWNGVTESLRAMKQEGDLVVIAPGWADPAARKAFGDALMPMRDVARPDESRYAHAVEVSILGEHAPELSSFREIDRRQVGRFLLRRLENPAPAHVAYDFVDHLDPATVDVRGTEPPVTCTWNPRANVVAGGLGGHPTFPAQRFECPGGVFFHVGVTIIGDEEFRPRRCLWSHPFARGEIVTRYKGVPLGKTIHGHGGMYWMTERELRGAPITLTVRVDGDTVGSVVHKDGDGWAGFDLPLGAHAGAPAATVEFAVSSTNYHDRHFCFEADTR